MHESCVSHTSRLVLLCSLPRPIVLTPPARSLHPPQLLPPSKLLFRMRTLIVDDWGTSERRAKCQHDKLVSVLVGSSLSVPRPPKKSHPPKKKQLWRQPGSLPRLGFDLTPSLLPDLASDMMSHVSGLNVLNLHEKRQSHITLSSRQSHGFTKHHMPNVHCQPRAHQHPTRLDEEGEGAKQSIPSKRATPKSQAV